MQRVSRYTYADALKLTRVVIMASVVVGMENAIYWWFSLLPPVQVNGLSLVNVRYKSQFGQSV